MSRWFRHYAGMMRDDKLVRVAIRSGQTIERVVWIWGAILESAAEIDNDGRFDFDTEEAAYFLRAESDQVRAVIEALGGAGRIEGDHVCKWGNRQFASDRSKDRVAAHRERKRAQTAANDSEQTSQDGEVTLQRRHRNSPETETETDQTPGEASASPAPRGAGPKGSRISVDWSAPPIDKLPAQTRALVAQWPVGAYEVEAEAHLNYWLSEIGPKARKSDWDRVWYNRVAQVSAAVLRSAKAGVRYDTLRQPGKVDRDYEKLARQAEDRAVFYDKLGRADDAAEQRKAAERFWHLRASAASVPLAGVGGT